MESTDRIEERNAATEPAITAPTPPTNTHPFTPPSKPNKAKYATDTAGVAVDTTITEATDVRVRISRTHTTGTAPQTAPNNTHAKAAPTAGAGPGPATAATNATPQAAAAAAVAHSTQSHASLRGSRRAPAEAAVRNPHDTYREFRQSNRCLKSCVLLHMV